MNSVHQPGSKRAVQKGSAPTGKQKGSAPTGKQKGSTNREAKGQCTNREAKGQCTNREAKGLHQPGIEPGSHAWEANMIPLHHWCWTLRAGFIPLQVRQLGQQMFLL